jgi:hypothetical protein
MTILLPQKGIAIAWASGLIEFIAAPKRCPAGAIVVARGDLAEIRKSTETRARHGYDGTLLVPGVPEAETPDAALDALIKWRDWAFGAQVTA